MVAWEDAKVHVLTHGLHYGTGVFEGERAYETQHGTAIFRHRDHLNRLFKSAELYYMPIPYTLEELRAATHELIAANELRECYVRPIAYRGYGQMGLYPLDSHGFVCEGTGENVFIVREGQIVPPPQTAGILDGINRKSVIQIAHDLGYEVVERDLARAELYLADEVFLSGTAAELVPVREIDDHQIGGGRPGAVTREIQRVFDDALHGRDPRYADWLDVVKVPTKAP